MDYGKIRDVAAPASRVGLGTWAMGGKQWGGTEDDESVRTIRAALDLGITLIDTAPAYGNGHSEAVVGRAVEEHGGREKVVLATKCGLEPKGNGVIRNASRKWIFKEIEDSLKRLRTDYIDLYQVHWPDAAIPHEETAGALVDLKKQGKILAIGVSNYSIPELEKFSSLAPLATVQPPLNLFEQKSLEKVIPWCQAHGVGTLTYGALCRGLLTGTIDENTKFPGDDLRNDDPKFQQPRFGQYLKAVRLLDRYAHERYGKTVLPLAIRWVLEQPTAPIALWGARHPSELSPIDDIFGWSLDQEALSYIQEVLRESIPEAIGSEFMAPPPSQVT